MKTPAESKNDFEYEDQSMIPHVWVGFLYYDIIRVHKIIGFNELLKLLLAHDDLPEAVFTNIEEQLEHFGVFFMQQDEQSGDPCYIHRRDCSREEIKAMLTRHPFLENISWWMDTGEQNYKMCFEYINKCSFYKN